MRNNKEKLRFPTNRSLILYFLRGSVFYFFTGAVCACLVALFDLIIPRMIQYTVDAVIGGNLASVPGWAAEVIGRLGGAAYLRNHLWLTALAVAAAAGLGALSRYGFRVCNAKGAEAFVRRTRDRLYRHILSLPYSWQGENSTGDTIQRCTSDVETIKIFVSEQLTSLLRVFILIFMSLYFMVTIQPKLTAAAAVFIPVMIISSLVFYGLIGDEFEKVDSEEGRLSAIAQENLTGVRVVRTFGREKFERERFEAQNEFYTDHWYRLMRVLAAFWVSGNIIATVRNMTVAVFGAVLCVHDQLTAGGLIAFLSYNALMSLPVRSIGRIIADMSKTGVSMERLRYIMNAVPEEAAPLSTPPMDRDIVFSHVSFRYGKEAPEILRDINMTIRAGTTVGILGATGAGKSTLMLLLDRLWELPPEWGTITVGGVDIRQIDRAWLRRNIGMVLQEPYLFSRTLAENIAIAMPEKVSGSLPVQPETGSAAVAETDFFMEPDPDSAAVAETGFSMEPDPDSAAVAETDFFMEPNPDSAAVAETDFSMEPDPDSSVLADPDSSAKPELEMGTDGYAKLTRPQTDKPDGATKETDSEGVKRETDPEDSFRMQEIRRAAQTACLEEAIDHFADGYDTFVGERGVTLSGGQKQRAAIAQMLVRHTPIMIFDDSLSAVDAETDARIRHALRLNTADATVILIAHRITTLQHADQIFVLDGGTIAEHGTHEQLLAQDGIYSRVYALQTGSV